ncbi:MAG: DEAD/DEAH box helicase [Bacteroidaceae bacterium]|nr:DEAD/DEAH box helicase [Bacteroidaceae bacterium]
MKYDITRLGIEFLNPMQQEMLQYVRQERQLVLLSPTGSGKTLAYMMPLLQLLDSRKDTLQALVLVPSRELAIQTVDVVKRICSEARVLACYGGRPAMDEHRQITGLRPHLIVATPGRILDHIRKQNIMPAMVTVLVIDEFDKCLELGFQEDMKSIISELTAVERRILLSATDSPSIPVFVGTSDYRRLSYLDEEEPCSDRIAVRCVPSPEKDKLCTLKRLLCTLGTKKSLVFANHRQSAERIGAYLSSEGIMSDVFHGGMEQRDRERALYRFINGSCNVFVCTDLASRGLDIPDVDNIIHYHLPIDEEAYIHRNGRTARWENVGNAYLLLGPEETLPEYAQLTDGEFVLSSQSPLPSMPLWATIYIGKGKKDKISRGDILGFLTKVGGLEGKQIGRIDVLPNWSYVAVQRKVVKALLSHVKGQKIKGIKTIFALAE